VTGPETQGDRELVVCTDGLYVNDCLDEARARCGVWYRPNDPQNTAIREPGEEQSNEIGELFAILRAVRNAPGDQRLKIYSDSRIALEGLTRHATDWEA